MKTASARNERPFWIAGPPFVAVLLGGVAQRVLHRGVETGFLSFAVATASVLALDRAAAGLRAPCVSSRSRVSLFLGSFLIGISALVFYPMPAMWAWLVAGVGLGLFLADLSHAPTQLVRSVTSLAAGCLERRLDIAFAGLATVAVGVLHVVTLWKSPVGWDEGLMLSIVQGQRDGRLLYADLWTQYPPGIYAALYPCVALYHDVFAARLFMGAVNFGVAAVAALMAWRATRDVMAPLVATAFALATATVFEGGTLMSDPPSTLPCLLAFALLGGVTSAGPLRILGAGGLLALGTVMKQVGALYALPLGLMLMTPSSGAVRRGLFLVAGYVVVCMIAVVPFLGRERAFYCVFGFVLTGRNYTITNAQTLFGFMSGPRESLALLSLPLSALALGHSAGAFRAQNRGLAAGILFSLLPFASRPYAHYALPSLAGLAVLSGIGAGLARQRARGAFLRLAIGIALCVTLGAVVIETRSGHRANLEGGAATLEQDRQLLEELEQLARPGTELLATWPIAHFANSYPAPTRLHYDLVLTSPGDFWFEEWRRLAERSGATSLLVVPSRRVRFDLIPSVWQAVAPDVGLQPVSEARPSLRPLVVPQLLQYHLKGYSPLQLLVRGAPPGTRLVIRGKTASSTVRLERADGSTQTASVVPLQPFEAAFDLPREGVHLARATVPPEAWVVWDKADSAGP